MQGFVDEEEVEILEKVEDLLEMDLVVGKAKEEKLEDHPAQ